MTVLANLVLTASLGSWSAVISAPATELETTPAARSNHHQATVVPCPPHDLGGAVECRTVEVAENPATPAGRRLHIELMVLQARAAEPRPDPLVVIPGGPGQSATRSAGLRSWIATVFDPVRATRDVVLVAPRGTAGSGELALEPPDDLLFASLDTVIPPAWAQAARSRLAAQADLSQYTTSRIVDDLEIIRKALGAPQLNLYGTSYGTRVVQAYAARMPDRVRSMILKSPLPPETAIPLTYTAGSQRALERLFARCAASPGCASAHPDLAGRFDALMTRLRVEPVPVTVKHPFTGRRVEVVLTDTVLGYLLRNLLMSAAGAPTVLAVIDEVSSGETATVAALIPRIRAAYARELAGGMALSVIATEDAPRVTAENLADQTTAGFLRGAVARGIVAATLGWPRGEAPVELFEPVRVAVPTLVVAGALDPATPPELARRVAARLTRSRLVVYPYGAHSASNFTGLDQIMARFVESADPRAVDDRAARSNRPVELVPGD